MRAYTLIGAIAAVAGVTQATTVYDKAGKGEAKPARGTTHVEIVKSALAEAGKMSPVEVAQRGETVLQQEANMPSIGATPPRSPSPAAADVPAAVVPQQVGSHAEGDDLRVLGKRRRGPGGLPHAKWQRLSLYGAARQAGGSASGTATDALLLAARLFGDAVADAISQRQRSQRWL